MPYRKTYLGGDKPYHVFTKSIAGYKIFNSQHDYRRIIFTLQFYALAKPPYKLSYFLDHKTKDREFDFSQFLHLEKSVKILAYCIMPTHIHLVLQSLKENGISQYMNVALKSYTKYFNIKYRRKGPLWEGRFKNVLVDSDEQLSHLTRYIHLNPVSVDIVKQPEDWIFSSYREYIGQIISDRKICDYDDYIKIVKSSYKKFVDDQIGYQRELEKIKRIILE